MSIGPSVIRAFVCAALVGFWPAVEARAQPVPPLPAPRETGRDTARADTAGTRTARRDSTRRDAARSRALETVPGLIVTQHSGEGKANQYFVRGFNLDHGTDFQTRLDGMPLNMPTHGHGQG